MKTQLNILGVRKFKDTVEGTEYDFTKLVVSMPFPSKNKDTQIGSDTQHLNYGDSKNFDLFAGRKFPLIVAAEVEFNSKGMDIIEVDLPPLATQQKAA